MGSRRMIGALSAAMVLLVACGGAADTAVTSGTTADATTESSPFGLDESTIPEGFVAVAAGTGTSELFWGEDTGGSPEPFVLLGPPDEPGDMVISLTGYAGYQGGLSQASLAYSNPDSFADRDVGGKLAHYTNSPSAGNRGSFAKSDLVVVHDDMTAIRVVTSYDAAFEELAAIVPLVEVPPELGKPPTLASLPGGRDVKGSLSSDVVLAFNAGASTRNGVTGTPPTAHQIGWVRNEDEGFGSREELIVITLPGAAGEIGALAGFEAFGFGSIAATEHTVDDRRAVSIAHGSAGFENRSLLTTTPGGDLLMVASSGPTAFTTGELIAIATTVETADQASWDVFVEQVYGGPELRPDDGAVELVRGEASGIEWLAQSPSDDGNPVDECLKLSNRSRVCARGSVGSSSGTVLLSRGHVATEVEPFEFPAFALVIAATPGETVHLTTDDGRELRADLTAIPGGDERVAVLILGPDMETGLNICRPFPAPGEFGDLRYSRVDVLDDTGSAIGCVGIE